MKLTNLIFLLGLCVLLLFTTPSVACKCIAKKGGQPNDHATRVACKKARGRMVENNDCDAHTMSERLSNFHRACEAQSARSSCRCPVGCLTDSDDESDKTDFEVKGGGEGGI